MSATYEAREVERVTRSDPDGLYRLRIESDKTGVGTRHLNITREQVELIKAILSEEDA